MGQGVLSQAHDRSASSGVLSPPTERVAGALHMQGVPLAHVAEQVGTPAYVYSLPRIREQYHGLANALDSALGSVPHRIHYSVKANSNRWVLDTLRQCGAGVDIVSLGELHRALAAGFTGRDIVFSGVGKTADELAAALDADVLFVNVESEGELRLLDHVAAARGALARVALRVNPEVTVETPHEYIRTGEKGNKFGIPIDEIERVARDAQSMGNIQLVGLDMHIGSQISRWEPYADALARIIPLVLRLREQRLANIEWLDIGGGLAVTYEHEPPADVARFAHGVAAAVRTLGCSLVLEPGRFLVAESGVLLTRVLYRKRSGGKEYIITDAGMNDLVRPSHYQAYHHIEPVLSHGDRETVTADVVGPVCESGDFLALSRALPDVQPEDLLAIHTAGAYGYVMASTYNTRGRPAEVVVEQGKFAVATVRETVQDLLQLEQAHLNWTTGSSR